MAAIDLTGQASLNLTLTFDELASTVTLTIKDALDTTTLGTVKMDQNKFRPTLAALANLGPVYYPTSNRSPEGYKLTLDQNANAGTVSFG